MGAVCNRCDARRIDSQLGLEPTPDAYVATMVEVFREVRRVLTARGTLWLNLGDSYAANRSYQVTDNKHIPVGNTKASTVPIGLKSKDMVGIPWRVAFALQADGWWLRSDIIWAKPNPMPESVTDRPTKAHEYVFLLSKSERYFFDQDAVREPNTTIGDQREGAGRFTYDEKYGPQNGTGPQQAFVTINPAGRNIRSVWTIATQPYPDAHFATFPRELPERCIKAGCPEQVCATCGKARERIVKVSPMEIARSERTHDRGQTRASGTMTKPRETETLGWTDCGHGNYRPGVVLDPFAGSGTTLAVARDLGRKSIGIELSAEYVKLIERRCAQTALEFVV